MSEKVPPTPPVAAASGFPEPVQRALATLREYFDGAVIITLRYDEEDTEEVSTYYFPERAVSQAIGMIKQSTNDILTDITFDAEIELDDDED